MPKKTKPTNIYQFKISLDYSKPLIWRRIQVPDNYTFWDLHCAIQDVFGWYDCHLHCFNFNYLKRSQEIRIETTIQDDPFDWGGKVYQERQVKIKDFFDENNATARYEYDFGDGWVHHIKLEKILPADNDKTHPICLTGKRACPPEDIGGWGGYERFVDIINNPKDEEYGNMVEWYGEEKFDPDYFNVDDVVFDNPGKAWKHWGGKDY